MDVAWRRRRRCLWLVELFLRGSERYRRSDLRGGTGRFCDWAGT